MGCGATRNKVKPLCHKGFRIFIVLYKFWIFDLSLKPRPPKNPHFSVGSKIGLVNSDTICRTRSPACHAGEVPCSFALEHDRFPFFSVPFREQKSAQWVVLVIHNKKHRCCSPLRAATVFFFYQRCPQEVWLFVPLSGVPEQVLCFHQFCQLIYRYAAAEICTIRTQASVLIKQGIHWQGAESLSDRRLIE